MAQVNLLYLANASGRVWHKPALNTDELMIGKVTAAGVGGVAFAGTGSISATGAISSTLASSLALSVPTTSWISGGRIDLTGISGVSIDGGGVRAVNFGDPTGAQDLATKNYVDTNMSGLSVKEPVRAATTANIATLGGGAPNTLDGVTLAANDRVLVKDQTTGSQNGIYVVTTLGTGANGTWTRATDCDANAEVKGGLYVFVNEGTTWDNSAFVLTTNNPITVGTTALVFTQFSGLGQIVAGLGLTKTGNTLNVGAGNGITVNADDIAVNLDTASGLEFNGTALRVDVDTARGINRDATGVFAIIDTGTMNFSGGALNVTLDPARGITENGTTGIGVNIGANVGLAFTTNALGVVANTAQAINLSASGVGITLATDPGLEFSTGIRVKTDPAATGAHGAITRTSAGIGVVLEASNPSLQIASSELGLKMNASGGLQKVASGVEIKLVSTDRLSLGASGLDVVGLPTLFEIGGVAVSANVTAANLNTLTAGSSSNADSLHTHAGQSVSRNAGAGGVTANRFVYLDTTGTWTHADKSADATSQVYGIAAATAAAGVPVAANSSGGPFTFSPQSGSTFVAGDAVFLGDAGECMTYANLTSGDRVIRVGWAVSSTTLLIAIMDYAEKP